MDACFSKGRFLSALSKRFFQESSKQYLYIFEEALSQLHEQAEKNGASLKDFYEGVVVIVSSGATLSAPAGRVAYETETEDDQGFREYLERVSHSESHVIEIRRSAIRFPPSNHEVTLELAHHLSQTKNLTVF